MEKDIEKENKINFESKIINNDNINNKDNDIKILNYKNVTLNKNKLILKKNIILKISNQLINNKINSIQDNSQNLEFLQIINILNYLDKSFSCYFFEDNNHINNSINNSSNSNININDFYYQQEFNIIKNIYSKIINDYNINFNESIDIINKNFINVSNKQINSNNNNNKYNKNYYYIYNILYDFIILILILNKNDINNNQIKFLSPVDKIFLCDESKEQKLICNILNNYLDINSIMSKENICQELKSIYYIISLYTKLNILKKKVKSNFSLDCTFDCNCNCHNKKEDINFYFFDNDDIKNDENNKNNFCLSKEDLCKIILKKDFIINQLETKIESLNNNENTFRDLEEENEINKKEIEDMKKMYDLEFELMASAVYGLGINLFFNKEQQHNEQKNNSSSWLNRQKEYIMEINE